MERMASGSLSPGTVGRVGYVVLVEVVEGIGRVVLLHVHMEDSRNGNENILHPHDHLFRKMQLGRFQVQSIEMLAIEQDSDGVRFL